MKNTIKMLFFAVAILTTAITMAQSTITGTVLDAEINGPLPGANVIIKGTSNGITTDFDGNFSLQSSTTSGEIVITYVGFETATIPFNGSMNIGTISLASDNTLEEVVIIGTGVIDLAEGRKTPVAVSTIRGKEIQLKASGNVEFGEAMKNTPSVYVSSQAGGFGDSQIFLRGFDQTNTAYLLNGQPINGMEDGNMYWSNWSGMSDVANAVQVQRGLGSSKLAISSVGGTVNIVSKTTDKKQGGFFRLLGGNDSYGKATISYNTGIKESGWAFSVLLDHWQAHRKYSIGTAGQGQNYMFSVGYKPNEKHSFNFLLTGAPQWHDQNFSEDLEFYEQYGEKANDNSGFYEGERFTERRNYYHKPVMNLNWDFNVSETLDVSTVLYASWGRGGGTGNLGRGRIRNIDTGITGANEQEINFDAIELNNIDTADANGNGNFGDSYLRRSSVNNHNWYGLLSNLNFEANDNWSFNTGFDVRLYRGDHFRQLNETFGLNGYVDNFRTDRPDDYVISETFEANPWAALFNFADEDQRYDRDYSENINYIGGFGQIEYTNNALSLFVQGAVSSQSYQREGRLSGVGDGLGESEKLNKLGYQAKGGIGYELTENHSIFANAGFFSRQPFLDNVFANIRYSNALVEPEVENEDITGLEAGYRFKNNNVKVNLDLYHTQWGNRFLSFGTSLPLDEFGIYRFNDVTQIHNGVEFDLEYRPDSRAWSVKGYGSIGNWKYDNETPFTLQNDDTGEFIIENGTLNLTDVKVGNAPQTSFGVGFMAKITDGLSVDMDYNIYTDLYEFVDVEQAIVDAIEGRNFQSVRLPAYTLADAGLTYKFSLGDKPLTFRANVYNLFNEAYINQRNAFGYYLGIGRTFNASLRYNF